jgi:hypothetical protein
MTTTPWQYFFSHSSRLKVLGTIMQGKPCAFASAISSSRPHKSSTGADVRCTGQFGRLLRARRQRPGRGRAAERG